MKTFSVSFHNVQGDQYFEATVKTEFGFKNAISLGTLALKSRKHNPADVVEIRVKKLPDAETK